MLTSGMRLGAYEILGSLGAGGMGEVYRARDTRLRRDVALKLLSRSVAADPERLARFQREAEVLAALNHPHIAQIYGFEEGVVHDARGVPAGEDPGQPVRALVMELVEGETLAERIAGGALPLEEALAMAKQIAEALEAAHARGIVHRDLKPANIKVRADGTVKVLDFGLAKAMEDPAGTHGRVGVGGDVSQSPTMTSPGPFGGGLGRHAYSQDALVTGAGALLGTAAYMSPEQAKGRPTDKRSDIWAFGCVLYEMLTGQRAFPGDDVADVLAAVLAAEPDWTLLPAALSPTLRQGLKRCLQRDPRQRLADAQDLRLAIEGAFDAPASAQAGAAAGRRRATWLGWAAAAIAAGVAAAALLLPRQPTPPAAVGVVRFAHVLTQGDLAGRAVAAQQIAALSPDGRYLVYNTPEGLYLRAMDALEARLLPGTDNAWHPFFSPDSRYIGYVAPGELRRVAIDTGTSTVIARLDGVDAVQRFGGVSWDVPDTILVARDRGIVRVTVSTGATELVIPVTGEEQVASPHLLPGGDVVLFTSTAAGDVTRWDEAEIVGQSLRTGTRTTIWRGGSDARFVAPRHLLFAQGSDLFAIAFDPARLAVSGQPAPVVSGVQRATLVALGGGDAANYGVSSTGTLAYLAANPRLAQGGLFGVAHTLVWVDREGREEATGAPTRAYLYPRLSPDGTRVAVDVRDAENDIWIWDTRRVTLTRFTFDRGLDRFPTWSPDGRRIAYSSQRDGSPGNLFWQSADGAGQPERLLDDRTREMFPTAFTPDGRQLLEHGEGDGEPGTGDNIGVVGVDQATRTRRTLLQTPASEQNAALSPDGRWIAYESDESGRPEIYVRPFPDVDGGRWQVSTGGGTQPLWARNGRELFYRAGNAVMAAPIDAGPGFAARTPRQLFAGDFALSLGGRNYDVSPDGRRFLMLKAPSAAANAPPFQIVVVQRWVDELNRLVPGR